MTADKPRRLGRGLEALIATTSAATTSAATSAADQQQGLQRLPIAQIRPNPYQPRKEFRPDELADLEASLKESGLLQPITVRTANGAWELIAGERRLRAATRLGWTEIPAVVKNVDDRTLLVLALVENLQRANLNPLEEAEGYQRLIDEFSLTQQQVADVVGKDRTTVANTLRVLQLPPTVRRMLADGELSAGHARALLVLGDEREITEMARDAAASGLSVREVERRARERVAERVAERSAAKSAERDTDGAKPPTGAPTRDLRPAEARRIEEELRRRLQTDVQLVLSAKEKGSVRIPFYSADDLERLLDLILGEARDTI
jgi:ParB family transcriptional regulator, chromosome partitioning protein